MGRNLCRKNIFYDSGRPHIGGIEMTKIGGILNNSVVDGKGLRTAIFFSGCRRNCPGCHNPELQNFNHGKEYTLDQIKEIISKAKEMGDEGITLSGGHPLEPENYEMAYELAKEAHAQDLNVWLYTGYIWDKIPLMYMDLIAECDVVVDGPFIMAQRSVEIPFRGSTNQRLIDVKQTFDKGEVILWEK